MSAEEERSLLRRLRAGEQSAATEFVEAHYGRMLAVARRILRDDHAAADAVQDAFLSAFKALERFAGDSALGTWLHRIVINAALMKLRSQARQPDVLSGEFLPAFDQTGHFSNRVSSWAGSAESLLEREETRTLVRTAIDKLPDTYRTVVLLRDLEGLDTEATAELLGTSTAVIKTRLHRARQALRTLLDPHFARE